MSRKSLTFAERIRKVKLLTNLLLDPEIENIARRLLSSAAIAENETNKAYIAISRKTHEAHPKHGALVREALNIVNNSPHPISAKEVANLLHQRGFVFEAQNKQIAVSKALRSLARQGKILPHKTGPSPKAAILYRSTGEETASIQFFPVQERAQ